MSLCGVLVLAGACGPSVDPAANLDEADAAPRTCDRDGDRQCRGLECAQDETARDYLEIVLEEVERAGLSEAFEPTGAVYAEASQQLIVTYEIWVDWYRVLGNIDIQVSESRVRKQIAEHFANWVLPEQVVSREIIEHAVHSCDPAIEYDPCQHRGFYAAHASRDTEPDCRVVASVDPSTGELLDCSEECWFDGEE